MYSIKYPDGISEPDSDDNRPSRRPPQRQQPNPFAPNPLRRPTVHVDTPAFSPGSRQPGYRPPSPPNPFAPPPRYYGGSPPPYSMESQPAYDDVLPRPPARRSTYSGNDRAKSPPRPRGSRRSSRREDDAQSDLAPSIPRRPSRRSKEDSKSVASRSSRRRRDDEEPVSRPSSHRKKEDAREERHRREPRTVTVREPLTPPARTRPTSDDNPFAPISRRSTAPVTPRDEGSPSRLARRFSLSRRRPSPPPSPPRSSTRTRRSPISVSVFAGITVRRGDTTVSAGVQTHVDDVEYLASRLSSSRIRDDSEDSDRVGVEESRRHRHRRRIDR
ncbi:hypothetical protein B0I35DRAFT_482339 [Stachybotrys elegans]|uniref:Uncharacterized protein n=1 Tax=Stachybotrys elegans TaxID=80388 RepID=A0A8K0SJ84_9HYPO|nr:hypothetical protein B0I35DRAFT_482339 [Stachybotrys elegans]